MSEALEIQIEKTWAKLLPNRPVTLFLMRNGRLVKEFRLRSSPLACVEVGTYTRAVCLQDLRDDVFAAWDELSGITGRAA